MVSKNYVDFVASYRTLPANAQRVADVSPEEPIEASIYLKPRTDPGPADAAPQETDRRAALRAHRAAQHQDDIKLLSDFAAENGLTITEVHPERRLVKIKGPASKIQAAFATNLAVYHDGQHQFRGRTGALRVPEEVGSVVQAILGLDTREAARPFFVVKERAIDPEAIVPLRPNAVGTTYSFPTGLTGAGQCIGIIELAGGYRTSDITSAFAAMGLAAPTVVAVSVDGGQPTLGGKWDGEVALDIQVAGGVAPGASIAVYFAPNTFQGWVDAVSRAVHDTGNRPSVLSMSWGNLESNWTAQAIQAMNTALQDAAQLGVTVFASSGDSLATFGAADGKAHVAFPASSPWIIGCGGTLLDTIGSTVNSEVVWNDGNSGTGGGISDLFPVPAFQEGVNLPVSVNDGQIRRGVPDVCGDAAPASGYAIVLNGNTTPIGGTSAVAPLWAGLTALINQAAPEPLGFFLPTLYQNPQVMRDITQGNNKPTGSNLGYTAGPGWDACTGLGAPIGTALLNLFTAHVIAGAVGVTTANQRPYTFTVSRNGHLWTNWFDGTSWHWFDLGLPPGGTIAGSIGATTVNGLPYAFVVTSNGHLCVSWFDGTAGHWSDQGPAGGPAGVQT
jgi:kumamolisin